MKKYTNIDYTQQPNSYWDDQDVLRALLRHIKDSQRRHLIAGCWKEGRFMELHKELANDTLPLKLRERLGWIYPAFTNGKIQTVYASTGVEIALITIASTDEDFVRVYARRDARGIRYWVADKYETTFEPPFKSSGAPLTLWQLVKFIEKTRVPDLDSSLALGYNEMNAESSTRAQLRHFTTISSRFYPQLFDHFDLFFEDWVKAEGHTSQNGRAI